jgi:NodT family efflux transporter outer membrane factor (OMF) lipoprotein
MNASTIRRPALAAILLLAGCTVGPDFKRPDVATPDGWAGADTASVVPAGGSVPVAGATQIMQWWTQLNDPVLTSLIERAAADNLSLAQAEARIRQARASRTIAASGLYPDVNASAAYARTRTPTGLSDPSGVTTNLFRAGFDATWEIDVFGGTRRGVEAAEAQIDTAYFDHESIMVSLAAEVATSYIELRNAQHQLAIARDNLTAQKQTLDVTKERFDAGFVGSLDVANATAQVTLTSSQIPNFESQAQVAIYALSVLLGQPPAALNAELTPTAAMPTLPTEVPLGLPSELLQRRPDLRRAQATLHATVANIGVAVAEQYPKFSLTGALGLQGQKFASLSSVADHFWSIAPAVSIPLFTGGRVQADIALARATADEAVLAYRSSVLTALQDVETSLVSFTREQERHASLAESAAANRQAVDIALELYSGGKTDFLNVLNAQGQLYITEAAEAQSRANVANDLISLYKALGGGWTPEDTTPPAAGAPIDPSPAADAEARH